MSTSLFQTVISALLFLPLYAIPLSPTPGQKQGNSVSVTINPSEATVHAGQMQTFEAVVKGTQRTGIR